MARQSILPISHSYLRHLDRGRPTLQMRVFFCVNMLRLVIEPYIIAGGAAFPS